MATLVLTVIGDDRAGLVNAVADVVARHDGNWEQSRMAELAGKFAGIVMVTVPDHRTAELGDALAPLAGLLDVTVQRGATDPPSAEGWRCSLDLVGTDRPGIVHDITRVLTDRGVSINELATGTREAPMAGGRVFEATATLSAPPGATLDELRAALEQLADELMVDITLDVG